MSSSPAAGFMVLHSNQLEGLRELAVRFIRTHPLPALAPEVLLVQSNGMKHWLELALAKELGVCAATQVALPSAKLWDIYRAVLGHAAVPAQLALDKSPMAWRILRRLPSLLTQPAFAPLAHYLNPDLPLDRRAYQLAMQLADVFDGYQNYRADWLADWALGHDQLRTSTQAVAPLPASHAWQAALWRDLLADVAADAQDLEPSDHTASSQTQLTSRADVHAAFVRALQRCAPGERPPGVPHRLMVFGVTSLPMQTVQALAALGRVCQVLMLVQNPCQYHWGHIVQDKSLPEEAQDLQHTLTHPLLAAWGKQGRDYLHLLDAFEHHPQDAPAQRVDVFIDPRTEAEHAAGTPSHLAMLQSSVLNLEPLPSQAQPMNAGDDSLVFRQTHSAQREVEVLHDQLLSWLDIHPHLSPNDIMVMVPDMAALAPHIHAVFGRFDKTSPRHLPYSVADTTPRSEPLVQALETLLQLPQLRITRTEWQNLMAVEAIRHCFGLQAQDVEQIDQWLSRAGVRWGLDAEHRTAWGMSGAMADAHQNSWLFGLERLLLGYASADAQAIWQHTLAEPGVGGLDASLAQGLLQWLRHTQEALHLLRQDHTPSGWVQVMQQLVKLFFKAGNEADERLLERVMSPLENWLSECMLARMNQDLPLDVVREHWLSQLQPSPLQRRFFGGGVQFATLMPMRAIPFQVVCLLGMNDGDYPRTPTPRDFDLLSLGAQVDKAQHHWRAGDRSRREDDRYLFLEALLAAREKLYISWQGRRTTDHELRPPSVLVAQLIDYLNSVWMRTDGQPAFAAPLQPLQGFSRQYFTQGSQLHTYATDWQQALAGPVARHVTLVDNTPEPPSQLSLQHLQRLLRQPVEVFLVDRLQLRFDAPEEGTAQEEPFALNPLENYLLSQRVASAEDAQSALAPLRLSGQLALAGFGQAQQAQLLHDRQTLRTALPALFAHWSQVLPTQSAQWSFDALQLTAQWAHDASIWRSHPEHNSWLQIHLRPGAVTEGKKEQPLARLDTLGQLWLNHVLACASGTPTTSVQIGLDAALVLSPIDTAPARLHLQTLCELYLQAWATPLPMAAKTAAAFWQSVQAQESDPVSKARTVFEGAHQRRGEWEQSTALQRVFDGFDDLQAHLPHWAERFYAPIHQATRCVLLSELPQQLLSQETA